MKRWIRFAASLYPAKWRQRYEAEFQALLDDIHPGWREFLNVLGGALKMRLLSGGSLYLKLAAAFAALGMLGALGVSLAVTRQYASSAVLRVAPVSQSSGSPDQQLLSATQQVVSRLGLAEIIQRQELNLYPDERLRLPLEDVVAKMASDLHIQPVRTKESALAVRVEFRYRDPKKAQAVVNAISSEMSAFFVYKQTGRQGLSVVEQATLPLNAVPPHLAKFLLFGLAAGTTLGLLIALTIRQTRRTLLVTSMGTVGCILGAGVSLLVPDHYISTAVIRIVPTDKAGAADAAQWLQQAASKLANEQKLSGRHDLSLWLTRPQEIPLANPGGATAMVITFEHPDPNKAQAGVQAAVLQLMEQNRSVSQIPSSSNNIEVLDNPSFPESPNFPNRMVISELGLATGLLAGFIFLWVKRQSAPISLAGLNSPTVPPSSRY